MDAESSLDSLGAPRVKNQYFGDRRDLVKYELLLDLVESRAGRRLTFVPMLTPDDDSLEGSLTNYECGTRRQVLHEFLRNAVLTQQRDVIQETPDS